MADVWPQRTKSAKDEWLTPPELIRALGEFDLDPCSPIERPWDTAKKHYTENDNGFIAPWEGRVWLNPPYGKQAGLWLDKLSMHGNGIALVFARTETAMFMDSVWSHADALLFIEGRIRFYHVNGLQGDSAGAPSVLVAYGRDNVEALRESGISGALVTAWTIRR